MSKVEEFLMKYNPEGVDNIPLWELTAWDKKFNAVDKSMQKKVIKYKYYLAKDLDALVDDTGDIRILYTNEKVAYTSEEKCKGNICEGEIVAIPWGGTPTVKYYNGKFVTGDNRIATSLDTKILNNKYLFYWMISQLGTIADFYRGAGIQHPSMISVLSMQIPLPHIKVQEEIVKILDSFTNLIDALNEELSLRQKQFEYYREKLLTFDETVERLSFGNDFSLKARIGWQGLTKKEYRKSGDYYLITGTDFKDGNKIDFSTCVYVDEERYTQDPNIQIKPNDVLITKDGTLGKVAFIEKMDKPATLNGGVFVVRSKVGGVIPKYVAYYLSSPIFKNWIEQNHTNGSIMHLTQKLLVKFEIAIPSTDVQQSIVEKLYAFESLISSLKEEIALRQKQYEYYREKLLTFD